MPSDVTERNIRRVARLIAEADALLITAGAGIGVDSGLPDFRGSEGFWRAYPALGKLGISFEEMAQPQWFAERPEMAWAFYGHRQQLYRETKPHSGFGMLLEWGRAMPGEYFVVTSNVDGQFQFADFDRTRILERHGNIHRHQCTTPCGSAIWYYEDDDEWRGERRPDLKVDLVAMRAQGRLPRCPECGAVARPNVLMFGDPDWLSNVTREQEGRYWQWLASVRRRRLVVLELGAGTAIPTIRRLGDDLVAGGAATLVRINPDATDRDEAAIPIRMGALEALRQIEALLPEEFRERCRAVVPRAQTVCLFHEVTERQPDGARRVVSADLISLKYGRMMSKAWKCRLANGIEVWVERLDVKRNYLGFELSVCVPAPGYSLKVIEEAREFVRTQFHGPEPVVIPPKMYDGTSDSPILPGLRFAARLVSHASVGDSTGSWMNLIWFAEIDDDKSIKAFVEEALAQVDWERQAEGFDY
jgi:NAD-dependent SIR2 family protein deacetylase